MEENRKVRELNVRLMQVYSAVCLWRFCLHIALKDDSIVELMKHLFELATCHDLQDWDQRGKMLSLTGRGDQIPSEIMSKIDEIYLDDFNKLHQSCVEVGIADMYGASTGEPKMFLMKCVDILKKYRIEVPSPEVLFQFNRRDSYYRKWGEPISDFELARILNRYEVNLS